MRRSIRKPGADIGPRLGEKILVHVGAPDREQLDSSVADALGQLELDRDWTSASAVPFISARTRSDTLDTWFDRIRSHPSAWLPKYGTRAGEKNRQGLNRRPDDGPGSVVRLPRLAVVISSA